MKLLNNIWKFLKTPSYTKLAHIQNQLKLKIIANFLVWGIFIGLLISNVSEWMINQLGISLGQHAIEKLLENNSYASLLFMAVIFAPVAEEALFRGPLIWFKNQKHFRLILYTSILLFAAAHLTNFDLNKQLFYVAPLVILPQLVLGAFLSYVRIKLGLLWAIYLHVSHNAILLTPILIFKIFNLPLE